MLMGQDRSCDVNGAYSEQLLHKSHTAVQAPVPAPVDTVELYLHSITGTGTGTVLGIMTICFRHDVTFAFCSYCTRSSTALHADNSAVSTLPVDIRWDVVGHVRRIHASCAADAYGYSCTRRRGSPSLTSPASTVHVYSAVC